MHMLDKFGRRLTEDESGDIRDVRTSCYKLYAPKPTDFAVVSHCSSQSQQITSPSSA